MCVGGGWSKIVTKVSQRATAGKCQTSEGRVHTDNGDVRECGNCVVDESVVQKVIERKGQEKRQPCYGCWSGTYRVFTLQSGILRSVMYNTVVTRLETLIA